MSSRRRQIVDSDTDVIDDESIEEDSVTVSDSKSDDLDEENRSVIQTTNDEAFPKSHGSQMKKLSNHRKDNQRRKSKDFIHHGSEKIEGENEQSPATYPPKQLNKDELNQSHSPQKNQKVPDKNSHLEERNTKRTQDPSLVPRVGRFFLHDDREGGYRRRSGNRDTKRNDKQDHEEDFSWKHDKYEEMMKSIDVSQPRPFKGQRSPQNHSNSKTQGSSTTTVYATGMNSSVNFKQKDRNRNKNKATSPRNESSHSQKNYENAVAGKDHHFSASLVSASDASTSFSPGHHKSEDSNNIKSISIEESTLDTDQQLIRTLDPSAREFQPEPATVEENEGKKSPSPRLETRSPNLKPDSERLPSAGRASWSQHPYSYVLPQAPISMDQFGNPIPLNAFPPSSSTNGYPVYDSHPVYLPSDNQSSLVGMVHMADGSVWYSEPRMEAANGVLYFSGAGVVPNMKGGSIITSSSGVSITVPPPSGSRPAPVVREPDGGMKRNK